MNPVSPPSDTSSFYDVFVIGGGINGAGIARDAAGRGLRVFLCEKGDLARGTSSASTKLIHGGLRYLEFFEFRLVREALKEREILLNAAPHIIWPMAFVLPHTAIRPGWLIRLGLFLYDHLAKRKHLPGSYGVNLRASRFGKPLKSYLKIGFVYADAWVEDSRLVVLNALDAAQRGASIHPYTTFLGARLVGDQWEIQIQTAGNAPRTLYARHIVNAAGPALAKIAALIDGKPESPVPLRLVKGSHIVVPRLYEGEHAYILQHTDGRIVFVIPFEDRYSLIGTTDQPIGPDQADNPVISTEEIHYLLDAVGRYFRHAPSAEDVVYTYSGVRPLFDDGAEDAKAVTRDYRLELDVMNDPVPGDTIPPATCLSVFGGKITTFRRLAEEAVSMLLRAEGRKIGKSLWTKKAVLPGGDIGESLVRFTQNCLETYPFVPEPVMTRWASHYGTRVHDVLQGATSLADLGQRLGPELYAREVDFLMDHEWARHPDDILLRRTKLGVLDNPEQTKALGIYMAQKLTR